jgi:hypothetical protein
VVVARVEDFVGTLVRSSDLRAIVVHGARDFCLEDRLMLTPGSGEVAVSGISGSDPHYWRRGVVAEFRLRQPLGLGHELAPSARRVHCGLTGPGTLMAGHPAMDRDTGRSPLRKSCALAKVQSCRIIITLLLSISASPDSLADNAGRVQPNEAQPGVD